MKNNRNSLIVAIMVIFSSMMIHDAMALSDIFNVANGDWAVAANWSIGTVPTAADSVFIRQGRIANISTDVGSITTFNIGDSAASYPPGTGTLNINSGGKLVVSTDGNLGRAVLGSIGILNLNGGTLQVGDATGSMRILVGLDATPDKFTQGLLNISGGTFIGRLLIGSTGVAGATNIDIVTITGSNATIGCTSTSGSALEVRETGVIKFVFGANGISTMDYGASGVGGQATFVAGSQIIVDGAAYTGGDATFNLIKAGVLGTQNATVILTNCNAGTTYSWNTTTDILSVNMKSAITKSLKLIIVQ